MLEQLERMKTSAREEYRKTVFAIVQGEEFPDDQILQATVAAGFSTKDLERHVATAKSRYLWAVEQVDAERKAHRKAGAARARVDELQAKLNRLQREFEEAYRGLVPQLDAARGETTTWQSEARSIQTSRAQTLRDTLPAGWRVGLDNLDREREEIERQLTPLLKRRHELQTALADREALEFRLESAETPQATDAAKKALAAHEGAQKQFDAVDERYRATQDELRAIRERIERHSAAMFDWRTVGFLTLDEEETVKARAEKSQLAFRAGSGLVSHPGGTLVGG